MLAKMLCLLTISAYLLINCEAGPRRQMFNMQDLRNMGRIGMDMSMGSMVMGMGSMDMGSMGADFDATFKNFDRNMKQTMDKMKDDAEKSSKKIAEHLALNVSDLALKFTMNGSETYYNTGGCLCKNYTCECCNLVESISETPTCFEYTFLKKTNELEVKQNKKILGITSVMTKTKDVCNADKSLCIHFYQPKFAVNTNFKGCSDLKIRKEDLTVKIGCFYMDKDLHFIFREFTSKHEPNSTTLYNFEGHPIEQTAFRVNSWSQQNINSDSKSINLFDN